MAGALVKSLNDCNVELDIYIYGLETMPLESPRSLLRLKRDRKPRGDNNKDAGSSDKLIHNVGDYLGEMAKKN
jgi:hypothetical protein